MKAEKSKNKILITVVLIITGMVLSGSRSLRLFELSTVPYLPVAQDILHEIDGAALKDGYETQDLPPTQDIPEGWRSLFDGETLDGWEIVRYGGEGQPYVKNGVLVLPVATAGLMTGIRWVGDSLPVNNYAIYFEARRTAGKDIFAGLSFPYGDAYASLIIGGWGGIVNGLSCIDGYDASENETTRLFSLFNNQWYPVQLRVTTDYISAIVGKQQIFDIDTAGKEFHLRPGLPDTGFTLWTYLSTGEIRNLRIMVL